MTWVGGGIVLPAVALSHFLPTPNQTNKSNRIQKYVYPVERSQTPAMLRSFPYIYNPTIPSITNLNNMSIQHLLRHKRPSK